MSTHNHLSKDLLLNLFLDTDCALSLESMIRGEAESFCQRNRLMHSTMKLSSGLPGCELPFSCYLAQRPGPENPEAKMVIKINYQLPQKAKQSQFRTSALREQQCYSSKQEKYSPQKKKKQPTGYSVFLYKLISYCVKVLRTTFVPCKSFFEGSNDP